MYPFVSRNVLVGMFGADLFESPDSIPIIQALTGIDTKPFECVGTREEIVAALALAAEKLKRAGESLPAALHFATQNISGASDIGLASKILASYGPHRIPPEIEGCLRESLSTDG
jgi:hypothetical protein